jgi:hypothetical protein
VKSSPDDLEVSELFCPRRCCVSQVAEEFVELAAEALPDR